MSKVERLFRVWMSLTDIEKKEFDLLKKKFQESTLAEQRVLNEQYETKAQTGPMSGGCPYCGR